jgi:uncharacterized protein with PQ loop repeat
MLVSALGIVALVCLTLFYIPQVIAVHNARELRGFYFPAWIALLTAVSALSVQAGLLSIWTAMAANIPGVLGTSYILIQILRKGTPHNA